MNGRVAERGARGTRGERARLGPPPRAVAGPAALVLAIGGTRAAVCWVLLAVLLVPFWIFFPFRDVVAAPLWLSGTERANGTVLGAERANYTRGKGIHERRVYRVDYRFTDGQGQVRTGHSYSTRSSWTEGRRTTVIYPKGHPGLSKINDTERSPFGMGATFVLLFPGLAALGVAVGVRDGRRERRLLLYGQMAPATLESRRAIEKKGSKERRSSRGQQELVFQFRAEDGTNGEVREKSWEPEKLLARPDLIVLYDPERPERAALMATMVDLPPVSGSGRWESLAAWRVLLGLGAPLLTLGLNGWYAAGRFL